MARKQNPSQIVCEYFTWRLFRRNAVWYADGRGGEHDLGKHSLGSRDRGQALENLKQLDVVKAMEFGLAQPIQQTVRDVSIAEGWELFLDHCARPEVLGGVSATTQKRYRAVRDKHLSFCGKQNLCSWSAIGKQQTEKYGRSLSQKQYADRTIYLELTTIVSISKWLIEEGHIPESSRFRLSIRRPQGTDTYCYSRTEVTKMVQHCRSQPSLNWLADVLTCLACTGLRIGELATMRWTDVDLQANAIRISDERSSARRNKMGTARRTKGRRSRVVPINAQLHEVLMSLRRRDDGMLYHGPRGGKIKPDTIRNIFIRDVIEPLKRQFPTVEGEIGFEHGRIHSFRHYFVSQAFLGGASEGEIMEWVGHRESKMVAHYRHLRNEDSQRKMGQLEFLEAPLMSDGPAEGSSASSQKTEAIRDEKLAQTA